MDLGGGEAGELGIGRSGVREGCGRDVLYERKVNKKEKMQVSETTSMQTRSEWVSVLWVRQHHFQLSENEGTRKLRGSTRVSLVLFTERGQNRLAIA